MNKFLAHGSLLVTMLMPLAGCGTLKTKTANLFERKPTRQPLLGGMTNASRPKPTLQDRQELKVAMARSLEKRGEIRQAKAIYEELASHKNPSVEAIHRLAVVLEKEGDVEAARTYFQRAIDADPENPELMCDMGYSCYLQEDMAKAERHLRDAVSLDPQLRRAHNTLGMVLARQGKKTEALVCFRRGGCNSTSAHLNLAFAQSLEGNLQGAEETYRTVKQSDPSSEAAHRGLVGIRKLAEKLAAAPERTDGEIEAVLERSTERTPSGSAASSDSPRKFKLVGHQEDISDTVSEWEGGIQDTGFVEGPK